jgi:hypothetical protein
MSEKKNYLDVNDSYYEKINKLDIYLITHGLPSGSMLLHSLLDSHPEIITIPGTPDIYSFVNDVHISVSSVLKKFEKCNPYFYNTKEQTITKYWYSGLDTLGNDKDESILTDKKIFECYFKSFLKGNDLSAPNIILAFFYSYSMVHGCNLKSKKIIVMHPHYHDKAIFLNNIFPKAKCIVTVRDPIQTYFSAIKRASFKANIRNLTFSHAKYIYTESLNVIPLIKNDIDFRIVKVEEFSSDSYVIREMCSFLGIDYNSSLKESTFNGKKWWGANPLYKLNKFSLDRHKVDYNLSFCEKCLFSVAFEKHYNIFGYIKPHSSCKYFPIFFRLLLPTKEDFRWFKNILTILHRDDGSIKYLVRNIAILIFERLLLITLFYKKNTHVYDKIIKKSLISRKYK